MATVSRDQEMIDNPMAWPNLALPLKRFSEGATRPDIGVLSTGMKWPDEKRVVYLRNLFDRTPWEESETIEYENTDALLADGWRVD